MSENFQPCNQLQTSIQSFSVEAIKRIAENHARIISRFSIEEVTDQGKYLTSQGENSRFMLNGPILIFIGQQAHPEPNSRTQYLMTSWAYVECFGNDYNIEILITLWGPFKDGNYSIEFSTVSTNTMVIYYDGQKLGEISKTYRTCQAKENEINTKVKDCL